MILITGGTGNIGKELIPALQAAGVAFKVMTRKPKTVKELRGKGIDAVLGDFNQPRSYGTVLAGIEQVFLLTVPGPDAVTIESDFLEAAQERGVRRVVRLSAVGANPWASSPLARCHGRCEEQLEASGMDWTILRPSMFMQILPGMYGDTVARTSTLYAPAGEARIPFVDTRDIAAVATLVLTTEGHSRLVYDLTGSEAITYGELAARLGTKLGRGVQYVDVPDDAAYQSMVHMGMTPWFAHSILTLFHLFKANGTTAVPVGTIARLTGRQPRMLSAFLTERLADFQTVKQGALVEH